MTNSAPHSPRVYELRIGTRLDSRWAATFRGLTLDHDADSTTVLRGVLPDQAALHGILARVRDAGLPLLSVTQVGDEAETPGRMTAAVYRRFGGPQEVRLEEVERPVPGRGELLVRVHASTVSAADHRSRARDVPPGLLLPSSLVLGFFRPRRPVLGMDVAGVVVAVGERVDGFAPGDEVVAMLGSRFGGHAEYAIVRETDAVVAKPANLAFEEAVALVFGGITAAAYLRQSTLHPGSRVLVNGASGAVGTAVVQLAKAAGAHVTAVSSRANHELVTSLGADRVVDYGTSDFVPTGDTYDIVVDCVGNAPVERVHGILSPGASVLLVAASGLGAVLAAPRQAKRLGVTVVTGPGIYLSSDLQHVVDLAAAGTLRPVVDRVVPFDRIADAHAYVDSGRKRGSVVVSIRS